MTAAKRVISTRSTQPVLANVLIQAPGAVPATLTATDLDTWLTLDISVDAIVHELGSAVAIPCNLLAEHVSRLPDDEVTIETEGTMVLVTCQRSKAQFHTLPAEDFPVMETPAEVEPQTLTIEQSVLKQMLGRVLYAASTEVSRSLLGGVLFECQGDKLTLVATDTHQLAACSVLDNISLTPFNFIIPATAIADLMPLLDEGDIAVAFWPQRAQFQTDGFTFTSRLLDGQFPTYEKVIPKGGDTILKLNRADLLEAVRRVHIISRDCAYKAVLDVAENTLEITAEGPNVGKSNEIVPNEISGPPVKIALNTKLLINLLSALDSETVTAEFNGSVSPAVFHRGDRGESVHVVMCMSL